MAEIFEFDPAKDIQVLETFTFDEVVERAETLRFYTLDEQVTDYFEKNLPVGKVSRHQLFNLEREADRVRDLYNKVIVGTDTAYDVRGERIYESYLPWILPVYTSTVSRKELNWGTDYLPIYAARQPRFYDRMIAGLPRPYSFGEGTPAMFPAPQEFVDNEGKLPLRAVPDFVKTRGTLHAGGRYEVSEEVVPNTGDVIALRGYWVKKRPLDLIAPLDKHPILESNEPHFFESAAAYSEVMPSVEAILNHAVPVTTHPFRDAKPYLAIYDIKWQDIPWSVWKRQFPPAEQLATGLPVEPIAIPQTSPDIPGEVLQKTYNIPYHPGLTPRYWLSQQQDGGLYVIKLLLSQAAELTPISAPTTVEAPLAPLPFAKPEDCLPDGITFENFLTAGVYRPPGVCVPMETIEKERAAIGMKGRIQWNETTHDDILKEYLPILNAAQGPAPAAPKEPVLPKVPKPEFSHAREDVLVILKDEMRTSEDKAEALRKMVMDLPSKDKQYLDEDGKFVLCEHSLSLLDGEFGMDNRAFYETWCGIVGGSRVCKFCGEAINQDVFVSLAEFDDDGHAVLHSEALNVAEFHPGAIRTFTESLTSLRVLFDTRDPAQDMFLLLISMLQVLPDQYSLEPIIGQVRQLSTFTQSKGDSVRAVYGICGMALLMQIHDPFLIPRRSFGTPFVLTGYPRDKDEGLGILDSILGALKRTFEQFRTTFKGPSMGLLREVFRSPAKVREKCVTALKVMINPPAAFMQKLGLSNYIDKLEQAALRYAKAPPVPPQLTVLVPPIRIDSTAPAKSARTECVHAATLYVWTTETPPLYLQSPIVFQTKTAPGPTARRVVHVPVNAEPWAALPSDTAARIRKAVPAFAKALRNTQLLSVLADAKISWNQASAIAGRLLDLCRVQTSGIPSPVIRKLRTELEGLDPRLNKSQLRDAARGIAFSVIDEVSKVPALREFWATAIPADLSLKSMLRKEEDIKAEVRTLITAERETFKTRLGEKSDMERELIKQLLDIGLAPYVILLKDRQLFAQQLEDRVRPVTEPETNVPEEGFQEVPNDNERDEPDQGERGDFGEMPNRPYEGDDIYGDYSDDVGV